METVRRNLNKSTEGHSPAHRRWALGGQLLNHTRLRRPVPVQRSRLISAQSVRLKIFSSVSHMIETEPKKRGKNQIGFPHCSQSWIIPTATNNWVKKFNSCREDCNIITILLVNTGCWVRIKQTERDLRKWYEKKIIYTIRHTFLGEDLLLLLTHLGSNII